MAKGKFIVFEGGEFVGKSSQLKVLASRLEEKGMRVCATKEPGGTPQGLELRARLLAGGLAPEKEAALFMEDRRIHVAEVLRPALERGEIVLCDRFSDSTIAYQHFGRGLDRAWLEEEDMCARDGLEPDLVILLNMRPEDSFKRAAGRGEEFTSFEREGATFHERVRKGFLTLARENGYNHVIVNGSLPKPDVSEKIWHFVEKNILL